MYKGYTFCEDDFETIKAYLLCASDNVVMQSSSRIPLNVFHHKGSTLILDDCELKIYSGRKETINGIKSRLENACRVKLKFKKNAR